MLYWLLVRFDSLEFVGHIKNEELKDNDTPTTRIKKCYINESCH